MEPKKSNLAKKIEADFKISFELKEYRKKNEGSAVGFKFKFSGKNYEVIDQEELECRENLFFQEQMNKLNEMIEKYSKTSHSYDKNERSRVKRTRYERICEYFSNLFF